MSPLNVTRVKSKYYEQYSVLSIIYAQTSLVYKGRDPYSMCSVYLVISKGEEGTAGKFHLRSSTVSREPHLCDDATRGKQHRRTVVLQPAHSVA